MAIPMATVWRETSINESVVLTIKQFICKSKVIYIFLVFARSKWKKKKITSDKQDIYLLLADSNILITVFTLGSDSPD